MASKGKKGDGGPTIIIKKEEVVEGGHHGGAWKVAYADFVTAMMAFFLLMWLLNATTEKQKRGLADYFAPTNIVGQMTTGSGQPFAGHTPTDTGTMVSDKGVMSTNPGPKPPQLDASEPDAKLTSFAAAPEAAEETEKQDAGTASSQGALHDGGGQSDTASVAPVQADYMGQAASGSAKKVDPSATDPSRLSDKALRAEVEKRERADFAQAAKAIQNAVSADPSLSDLGRQLRVEMTPQGLRIQLLDADKQAMFATGSSEFDVRAKVLLAKVGTVLAKLPEAISITGHTDATPFKGLDRSNWELSSERANATRRLLTESGLPESRFASVAGNADRDPLLPGDPLNPANRRIAIVVLRTASGP